MTTTPEELPAPRPTAIRVLLVADDAASALTARDLLSEAGEVFAVEHSRRLSDALDRITTMSFDCVLLDLTLPDARPLEAVAAVRTADAGAAIVVLSGVEDDDETIRALEIGAEDYLTKGHLSSTVVSRAVRYAVARKRSEFDLVRRAMHDPLTGVTNRLALEERLPLAVARAARVGRLLAVVFVDLDHFKQINDQHGHAGGDEVLIEVASRLREIARDTDVVARIGGDEFVVVCEDMPDPGSITALAQRISGRIAEPIVLSSGVPLVVSASLGMAVAEPDSTAADLLRRADAAMYGAKRTR